MRVTPKFAALALLVAGTATCSDPDPLPSDSGQPGNLDGDLDPDHRHAIPV